jgi:uncharacterized protein YrrD
MITGKQLHGLQVLTKDGLAIGTIDQIVAKKNNGRVIGFMISKPGFFSSNLFVPVEKVLDIGLNGLIIANKDILKKIKRTDVNRDSAFWMDELKSDMGHITDVIVEDNQIKEVEVSQGLINDIKNGRQTIPWDNL